MCFVRNGSKPEEIVASFGQSVWIRWLWATLIKSKSCPFGSGSIWWGNGKQFFLLEMIGWMSLDFVLRNSAKAENFLAKKCREWTSIFMTGNTHQPRNYIFRECIAELLHHILKVNLIGSIQIESSNHAPRVSFQCLNHSQLTKNPTIPPFFKVQLLQGKHYAEKIKGIIVSDNWLTYIHKPCHPIPNCKA